MTATRGRHLFRYERRGQRPLEPRRFIGRLVAHAVVATLLVAISLALGMAGYAYYERLSVTDAFLNAAMLLGGMGPVNPPQSAAGKWFAGAYALYAGLVFLVAAGIVVAPVVHRVLHRFHWEDDPES